jgi:hypothetical protein
LGLKGTAFSHPPGPPTRFSLLFSSLAALRLTARVRLRHVWGASHPPMRGLVLRLRVRGCPEKLAGPSVPGTAYLLRPLAVRPGMRVHMCFVSCCVCLAPRRFLRNAVQPMFVPLPGEGRAERPATCKAFIDERGAGPLDPCAGPPQRAQSATRFTSPSSAAPGGRQTRP